MCTRFVYRGEDVITGFNFDIDLAAWDHEVICDSERFYIGILRPDGRRHGYHGVNRNGNAGTLLYVHGNPAGACRGGPGEVTVAELTERFICAELDFDAALNIVRTGQVTYAPDATMQSVLSDAGGRTLIIEPGIGYRVERGRCALMTNYSLLDAESTRPYIVPGYDRYERARALLDGYGPDFTVSDALDVLYSVRQTGEWATRVSFVYSVREGAVYYVLNNGFGRVEKHAFGRCGT